MIVDINLLAIKVPADYVARGINMKISPKRMGKVLRYLSLLILIYGLWLPSFSPLFSDPIFNQSFHPQSCSFKANFTCYKFATHRLEIILLFIIGSDNRPHIEQPHKEMDHTRFSLRSNLKIDLARLIN